jgi:phospholipase/carboxylesterase
MPVPEVDSELRRRAFLLPGVEERESVISLPGAVGLWLSEDLALARDDVLQGNREFAHIHPDGSLHISLTPELAREVDDTKWGELHPWVGREGFWEGVVMVYTPETFEELDITIMLIVDAYNFITGENVNHEQLT